MKDSIKINREDNVEVLLTPCRDIPAGHKRALSDIPKGSNVIKYGNPIGYAKEDIKKGDWVHVHNVKTRLSGKLEYSYDPAANKPIGHEETPAPAKTFMGYRRKGGVGVRNEIWIIPTVGCVNDIASELAQTMNAEYKGTVDAFVAMTHPYGCSQMGDDQENTAKILGRMAAHPNCAGALILSLGCENNNLTHMKPYLEGIDGNRLRYLVCQDVSDEIAEGRKLIEELARIAENDRREPVPVSELIVGLKCGGSDGFSGLTANPLVGRFSDGLIAQGGSTILTEVPEMFGAEQLLMNRAVSREVFDKTVSLINDFKDYYERHDQVIYENPSPGNKAGGITTLEDKSLGCVQKSGSAAVMDVLRYGDSVSCKGLNLLEGPGNDMVAVTALASAGAQIILFTTGRGTPLSSPVPTVKVATNSTLAERKKNWIDFDAGRLVSAEDADGRLSERIDEEFFEYVIRVASGEAVSAERSGYHGMTIFKQGVTL